MSQLKIGDKVKIRKLSEDEYNSIILKKYLKDHPIPYYWYCSALKNDFFKEGYITKYNNNILKVDCSNCVFYPEELQKVEDYLKIKIRKLKRLLSK